MRYLVVVLLVLRLTQSGAGRSFAFSSLVVGFISTAGTILMTAVPFSLAPPIHKLGIPKILPGVVGRNTPVVWEWLAFSSSVVWVFSQSILLGKTDTA